jgi:hypothetical protein
MGGVPPSAEDAEHVGVGAEPLHQRPDGGDSPGELEPGDVFGSARWSGIATGALQEVGAIDPRPRYLNEHFVQSRFGSGTVDEL